MSDVNVSSWFSAGVRFAVLVEGHAVTDIANSVYLLRAPDFETALAAAVARAKQDESTYENDEGQTVLWRLIDVATLDLIRSDELDGAEVYSFFTAAPDGMDLDFASVFSPEDSSPGHTGI